MPGAATEQVIALAWLVILLLQYFILLLQEFNPSSVAFAVLFFCLVAPNLHLLAIRLEVLIR